MNTNKKDLKILVVDDDFDLRESLVNALEEAEYKIFQAENGQRALEIVGSQKIDLICSDIRMPVMDGIQFFNQVKDRKIPFIMMTGFSELIDASKAHEMGVDEFISKPFTQEDLLAAIELCLHDQQKNEQEKRNLDQDYCRIHIDDFIMGSKVTSDVFLRLSEYKYLMVARSSNPLSRERLESFKKKGLDFLHIPKANFAAYVGFNLSLTQAALTKRAPITPEQKLHLLKHTNEVLLEDTFINGVDKAAYASGRSIMESTVQLITESDNIFILLDMLKKHSDILYAHSLGVGVYASLVAKQLGWGSQSTLFKVSMAGLFHDIGKKEIPKAILDKSRLDMNQEELRIYESHTVRAKEILSSIPGIPEEVVFAAIQHHESMSGCGFPYQLSRARIQPISRIISLCNEFCNLVLKSPHGKEVNVAHQAIEKIYTYKREDVDPSLLKALMEIFNYPLPEDIKKIQKFRDVKDSA